MGLLNFCSRKSCKNIVTKSTLQPNRLIDAVVIPFKKVLSRGSISLSGLSISLFFECLFCIFTMLSPSFI